MSQAKREANAATIVLRINRGEAGDETGMWEEHEIPYPEGMVVLDAVLYVQAHIAPDLAVRWNCKAARCGSCSAEVNGFPRLMCKTPISDFPTDRPITVGPLRTFRRIRDLIVDVLWNYEKNAEIPPFRPDPHRPWRWLQRDADRAQEMRKCIECFLCQDVCHVLRYQTGKKPRFAGPRYFVRAAGLDFHPMDSENRLPYLADEGGIDLCNITKCCTEVCPEEIRITDNAIIAEKERLVDVASDPLRAFFRSIRRKPPR